MEQAKKFPVARVIYAQSKTIHGSFREVIFGIALKGDAPYRDNSYADVLPSLQGYSPNDPLSPVSEFRVRAHPSMHGAFEKLNTIGTRWK